MHLELLVQKGLNVGDALSHRVSSVIAFLVDFADVGLNVPVYIRASR